MNRNYEMVVILDPELSAAEQEKLLEKIEKQITDSEGKASQAKELGKKQLAYPIKKRSEGVFYLVEFSVPTAALPSLRQKLLLEEKVLRYLVLGTGVGKGEAVEEKKQAPKEKKAKKK
jgi:small subunit ribosomal protein S6